jgi:replicative DNA helicase
MDELLTKQVPQSLEAEQSVLGSMLIDERCVPDVIGLLRPEDFYLQQNRDIYETVYTMFNFSEHVDPVTVLDKMKERGVYDEQHSYDYIAQLMQVTPTAANVKQYCAIVHDKALLRDLSSAANDISEMVLEGVGTAQDMLEAAEKKIYSLRKENSGESLQHIGKILLSVYDRLEELARSGSEIPGLSTGLHDLDRKINGLNKTDLLLIAARPGMGKTSMALNVALSVAKSSAKTVAFFSLEMSREQLAMRLLSNESFVDNQKLVTGHLSEEDWGKLSIASSALSQTDIRVDDNPAITVAEMNAKCRRLDNLGLVLIDYLQLMTAAGARQDGRQPRHRRERDLPRAQDHGQGAERAGHLPEPALPRQREPHGQAPHAVRPARIRRHRAGRRRGHVPLPRRLLQRKFRGEERRRVHRGEKPPRRDRHREAAVAAAVHDLLRSGVEA